MTRISVKLLSFLLKSSLLMLCCSFLYCSREEPPQQRNILFIAVDDLRPELGCFSASHIHSPNIDRLAERGMMFTNAHCNVPACGASRASLLTGVRPTLERFVTYYTRADEDLPGHLSLPRFLKNNGYATVSLGKVYHHADDDPEAWSKMPWKEPT